MKVLGITTLVAMAGLAQAAPSLAPRDGCDQGYCPASGAGFDLIERHSSGGNDIRINAHGKCDEHFTVHDGCAIFNFDGGFQEKVCIDRANNRATRTGTLGLIFHQCWQLSKSDYCRGNYLWTPSREVACTWGPAHPDGGPVDGADGQAGSVGGPLNK